MGPMLLVALAVLGLPVIMVAGMYNGLIRAQNHCDEAWSNIDTELKRRYELIPNLVSTVKGYAQHEQELLEQVTRLRAVCVEDSGSPGHQAQTENQLVRALGPLLARLENYPDLKANANFLSLQRELVNTEDRIQAARRFYNGNVRELNNKVEMFPSNIVAGTFAFGTREFFEVEDTRAYTAPAVQLA
jgi:LemA protein